MIYRKLGKSDVDVSVIGIGGLFMDPLSQEDTNNVIAEAMDHGANYLDVFQPQSEIRDKFANAVKGKRDKLLISGHIGAIWTDQYGRSREPEMCRKFFEDWLRRLGSDHVDTAIIHFVDEHKDLDALLNNGILELAEKLKEEGKTRFIGLSTHSASLGLRAVQLGALDLIYFPVNPIADAVKMKDEEADYYEIFNPTASEANSSGVSEKRNELYRLCEKTKTSIIAMKPFLSGHLLNPDNQFGVTLTPVQAMEYTLSKPGVMTTIPGFASPEQVRAAMAWLDATEEEKGFTEALQGAELWKDSKTCMYCNHCLPCPMNINIAAVTKLRDLAKGGMTDELKARYEALEVKPSECIQCRQCEENCPFGIPASENMQEAAAMYEV